jgi:hypothetical protein
VSLNLRRLIVPASFVALACMPGPVAAHKGAATGRVAIIDSPTKAYGFSSSVGTWTSVILDSPLQNRIVATYIGYLRTANKLYAFNSTTNSWYSIPYSGPTKGEDAQGSTAIVWTSTTAYGISTLWTAWRQLTVTAPLGGGSGGNYGLVWTATEAHAYSSSSGQWLTQTLGSPPVGGYASPGLGIVWTEEAVYVFDPVPRTWNSLGIADPSGISVDGLGKVGMAWSETSAEAYSAFLGTWSPLTDLAGLEGGAAGDEVAIIWGGDKAYAFDPHVGSWVQTTVEVPAGAPSGPVVADGAFSIGPNPTRGPLTIHLPPSPRPWQIEIINLEGERIRSFGSAESATGNDLVWDRRTDGGEIVSSGTYWIRAKGGDRVEARRFVVLH